jgi:hypothetical protein
MTAEGWRTADRWTGRVWLDGLEVTERCTAVRYEGERPVEVELYVERAPGGPFRLNDAGDAFLTERRDGDIRAELRQRGAP